MSETESRAPEGHCAYFLKKKRRFCRFRPSDDQKYCPEHLGLLGIDNGRKRINCPLNPKHTCFEDQLKKHLKKCPNRQKTLPPYHTTGINDGEVEDGECDIETKISWAEIPLTELQNVIQKIKKLFDEYVSCIEEDISYHKCLDEELSNEAYGIQAIRHRKQQASLIGHIEKMNLLHEGLCYVELGAGKGKLSHWIQKALPETNDIAFVLVDRSSVRYKADNLHKWEDNSPKFERLRIDISDLNLGKVESISKGDKPVVAIGKHLCGGATDLALRCVTTTLHIQNKKPIEEPECKRLKREDKESNTLKSEDKEANRGCLNGIAIALCCHHRCDWKTYVGKKFMRKCDISPRAFQIMCKLSGWATATWEGWKSKQEMENKLKFLVKDQGVNITSKSQSHMDNSGDVCKTDMDNAGDVCKTDMDNTGDVCKTDIDNTGDVCKTDMDNTGDVCKTDMDNTGDVCKTDMDNTGDVRKPDMHNAGDVHKPDMDNTGDVCKTDMAFISEEQTELGEERAHEQPAPLTRADLNLTTREREEIGRKCKRLIDYGRVEFLKDCRIDSELKVYIDEKLTPENVAILAKLSLG